MSVNETVFNTRGSRKSAVARVFLRPGQGNITIKSSSGNRCSLEDYFGPHSKWTHRVREPLRTVDAVNDFDIYATVKGGGKTGQADALILGIARALDQFELHRVTDGKGLPEDEEQCAVINEQREWRHALKKALLLRRDSRAVLRKLVGLVKARKDKQFSKR